MEKEIIVALIVLVGSFFGSIFGSIITIIIKMREFSQQFEIIKREHESQLQIIKKEHENQIEAISKEIDLEEQKNIYKQFLEELYELVKILEKPLSYDEKIIITKVYNNIINNYYTRKKYCNIMDSKIYKFLDDFDLDNLFILKSDDERNEFKNKVTDLIETVREQGY